MDAELTDAMKEKLFERITVHKESPHISVEQYVTSLQLDLGKWLADRKLIYLDQKYWILLRDAMTGRNSSADIDRLLSLLTQLVENGKVLCPMSDVVFAELLKQQVREGRQATAKIIDRLSLGVCIVNMERRTKTEIARTIYQLANARNLHSLHDMAWTRVCDMLGPMLQELERVSPVNAPAEFKKAFQDVMWPVPLSEIIDSIGEPLRTDWDAHAERTNEDMQAHRHQVTDFKTVFRNEITGGLDLHGDLMVQVFNVICNQKIGERKQFDRVAFEESRKVLVPTAIARAIGPEGYTSFPTLYVDAMCRAALRRDKERPYTGNDLLDFQHAAAALGYCDIFLTEKPLKAMLTARNMKLDELYECAVIADLEEAVYHIEGI